MVKIAPSILSADFARLGAEVEEIKLGGADYVHFDVMDGVFVPNITIGIPVLKSLRKATTLPIDAHLMIVEPVRYVKAFADAGADIINFHLESDTEEELINAIELTKKLGKKAGVTLRPGTPAAAAERFVPMCDLVLVMTVEPGFAGQSFMADMMPKVRRIREMINSLNPACELEVDGGVDAETAGLCKEAGADVLVAGSAVFGKADRAAAIKAIKEA